MSGGDNSLLHPPAANTCKSLRTISYRSGSSHTAKGTCYLVVRTAILIRATSGLPWSSCRCWKEGEWPCTASECLTFPICFWKPFFKKKILNIYGADASVELVWKAPAFVFHTSLLFLYVHLGFSQWDWELLRLILGLMSCFHFYIHTFTLTY